MEFLRKNKLKDYYFRDLHFSRNSACAIYTKNMKLLIIRSRANYNWAVFFLYFFYSKASLHFKSSISRCSVNLTVSAVCFVTPWFQEINMLWYICIAYVYDSTRRDAKGRTGC